MNRLIGWLFAAFVFVSYVFPQETQVEQQFGTMPVFKTAGSTGSILERSASGFSLEYPLSADTANDESEGMVSVHPTNPNFVAAVYHHFRSYYPRPGYSFSTDGGETWISGVKSERGFDPVGAWDDSAFYYCYIRQRSSGERFLIVSRTTDFGGSWRDFIVDSARTDKPWMTIDNSNTPTRGTIYVAWVRMIPWQLWFAYKRPADTAFSTPVVIDEGGSGIYAQGVSLAVNQIGVLVATYCRIRSLAGGFDLMAAYSTDGGVTFSVPESLYHVEEWSRAQIARGIDIFPGLTSLAVWGDTASFVSLESKRASNNRFYYSLSLYQFKIGSPGLITREEIINDTTRWAIYPSITNRGPNIYVMFGAGRVTGNNYYLEAIQHYVYEKQGNFLLDSLLAVPQSGQSQGGGYWSHHYNGAAISGTKVIGVFTDYRNRTNDFWSSKVILGPTGVSEKNGIIPYALRLYDNYPNPFNPSTTIKFALTQSSFITLKIYNILGEEIATLMDGEKRAGEYEAVWNAEQYASGIYFCRLQAGKFAETKKMVLMK